MSFFIPTLNATEVKIGNMILNDFYIIKSSFMNFHDYSLKQIATND